MNSTAYLSVPTQAQSAYFDLDRHVQARNTELIAQVRTGALPLPSPEAGEFLSVHLQAHILESLEVDWKTQHDLGIDLYFARALGGISPTQVSAVYFAFETKLQLCRDYVERFSNPDTYRVVEANLLAQLYLLGALLDAPTEATRRLARTYLSSALGPALRPQLRTALGHYSPARCFDCIYPDSFQPEHERLLLSNYDRLNDYFQTALAYTYMH